MTLEDIVTDPVESAKAAGLRYVTDDRPGIRREREGEEFKYISPKGQIIDDPKILQRIKSLAIPPAYTDVWICPTPNGHLQATARDARGRKQYRYHPQWRKVRDETKYTRMIAFGQALPLIRARVDKDLSQPGLSRQKVLAAVVRLLETTLIRVGNEEYAKENKSFGLTTMRDRHVKIEGSKIEFKFKGKSNKHHNITLSDRRLAKIVKSCRDIPGYELFQYIDENGQHQTIDSADVNEYLKEITGEDFTAKDFRTWAGTVLSALALQEFEKFDSQTQAKKNIVRAIEEVSQRLGNTPSVCRKCYVHPAILDTYLEGTMLEMLKQRTEEELTSSLQDLKPEEAAVLTLLQQRLQREEEHDRAKERKAS
ncbi:MAG TPA: DNA topoisomerase IB [Chloroflexia bacterium]|nr:DNA topoisomerase IB [Chloroflexia bacterium]